MKNETRDGGALDGARSAVSTEEHEAVRAAFDAVAEAFAREREALHQKAIAAYSIELKDLLRQWDMSWASSPSLRARITAHLAVPRKNSGVDDLFAVTRGGDVFSARAFGSPLDEVRLGAVLAAVAEPYFESGSGGGAAAWLPRREEGVASDLVMTPTEEQLEKPVAGRTENDGAPLADIDGWELFVIGAQPVWLRPDTPQVVLVAISSFDALVNEARSIVAERSPALEWQLAARVGEAPARVVRGAAAGGATLDEAFFAKLRPGVPAEGAALAGDAGGFGRWSLLEGLDGVVRSAWGVCLGSPLVLSALPESDAVDGVEADGESVSWWDEPFGGVSGTGGDGAATVAGASGRGAAAAADDDPRSARDAGAEPSTGAREAAGADAGVAKAPPSSKDGSSARSSKPAAARTAGAAVTPVRGNAGADPFETDPVTRAAFWVVGVLGLLALAWLLVTFLARDSRKNAGEGGRGTQISTDAVGDSPEQIGENLMAQFEINWKTFASYTQDLLQQRVRELEERANDDGPDRAVEEIKCTVAELSGAMANLRSEVSQSVERAAAGLKEAVEAAHAAQAVHAEQAARAAAEQATPAVTVESAGLLEQLTDDIRRTSEHVALLEGAESETRLDRFRDKEREFTSHRVRLEKELSDARKGEENLRDLLDESTGRERSLQSEVKSLTDETINLREQVTRLEKDIGEREAQRVSLAGELEGARSTIEKLKVDHRETLARELQSARRETENEVSARLTESFEAQEAEWEKERSALQTELETRNEEVLNLQKISDEKAVLEEEHIALGEEAAELRQQCEQRQRELEARARAFEALKEEKQHVENEVVGLQSELENLRSRDPDALEQEISELRAFQKENDRLRAAADRARDEIAAAKKSLADAQKKISEVERERLQFKSRHAELEALIESGERGDDASRRLVEAEETSRRLSDELTEAKETIERLTIELASVRDSQGDRKAAADTQLLERERDELTRSLERLETELEKARREAEEMRLFQGTLVDGSLPAAIIAVDSTLKVFSWNTRATAFWGKTQESVNGRVLAAVGVRGLDAEMISKVREVIQSSKPLELGEGSFTDGEGGSKHVRFTCDPIVGPDGKAIGAVVLAEDVSEKTEREIEARVQSLFNASLVRSLPAALVVADGRNRIISWNRNASDILGVAEEEALGEDLFELDTPLAREVFRKRFDENRRKRKPTKIRLKLEVNGVPGKFLLTQCPFYGEGDEVRGTILLLQEVALAEA